MFGAAAGWLALSADEKPVAPPSREVAEIPLHLPERALRPTSRSDRSRSDRGGPPGRPSPSDDIPRTRLPPGHEPASGPSIARVKIPSIGVNAPMIRLGLNRDETLQVPASASETGWWSGGSFPGRRGTAVIAGHVDSLTGPSVFYRLRELSRGDRVFVMSREGSRARFVVTHSERQPKSRFPTNRVYEKTRKPTLRLITCGGPFDSSVGRYRNNLIVFGRRA